MPDTVLYTVNKTKISALLKVLPKWGKLNIKNINMKYVGW